MMDMYKMAQEQAKDVKTMVELLVSLNRGLEAVCANQVDLFRKLTDIEDRLAAIEENTDIGDHDLSNLKDRLDETADLDDDFFDDDLFDDWNDEDEDDYNGCNCEFCCPTDDELYTREELEEIAFDLIGKLTSQPQLPYMCYGKTIYEYEPNKSTPIKVEVNEEKRTVVALQTNTFGRVVKVGKARCMPTDEFSPMIGAAIAVHRLFNLEVPEIFTK